jgi:hypothetical protein
LALTVFLGRNAAALGIILITRDDAVDGGLDEAIFCIPRNPVKGLSLYIQSNAHVSWLQNKEYCQNVQLEIL